MKIHELTLYSTNLDNQQRVYQERLGFDCNRPDQHRLIISAGETTLNFVHSERQFYYHYCFLVPTGCMDSIGDFLDERDFKALPFQGERIVDFGNGKSVYFLDGDGSIAEFIGIAGIVASLIFVGLQLLPSAVAGYGNFRHCCK